MKTELLTAVEWHDTRAELPDDETTVLLALGDGQVEPGFHEAGEWHFLSGGTVDIAVEYWAHYPIHPSVK